MLVAAHKSPEAFRTISEVATELDVPQHVLRFWETKFSPVRPLKRGGGRRYYRPDDVDLLRGIRALLYSDGLTIKGVQKILREQGPRYVMEVGRGGATLLGGARAPRGAGPAPKPAGRPVKVSATVVSPVVVSNVHKFPREADRDAHEAGKRARLKIILSELLTLKARLGASRPGSGISS